MWINLQKATQYDDIRRSSKSLRKKFIQTEFVNERDKTGQVYHNDIDIQINMPSWNKVDERNKMVYCDNTNYGDLLMVVASKLNY